MKYDGPAFFRRRDLIKSRTPKKGKKEYETTTSHFHQASRDLRTHQTQFSDNRTADDQTPAFLKEIRNFVPNHHDVNSKRRKQKKQIETNYFVSQKTRRSNHYSKLMAMLRIPQDDLIILADAAADEADKKRSPVTKSNQPIANDQVKATPDSNKDSQTKNLAVGRSKQQLASSATNSNQVNHSESTAIQPDAAAGNPIVSNKEQIDRKPAKPVHLPRPARHGLGQSLSAIVNKEQASKPDLSLFQESKDRRSDVKIIGNARETNKAVHQLHSKEPDRQLNNHDSTTEVQQLTPGKTGAGYQFPSLDLLKKPQETDENAMDDWIESQIETLDKTFQAFRVDAEVVDWTDGPTVTQFQIKLALGVKVSRITNLTDDLKLALAAKDIRIEAPIPGKSTVGIEIPNPNPRPVVLSEIIVTSHFKNNRSPLTTAMGVDLSGTPRIADVRKMPHGLIAGATGSGKSVFINSLLVSLLYKATPADLRLLLIDPKAVELAPYDGIPHLLSPVISDPKSAAAALRWVTEEMDQRYEKLSAAGVRNIEQFNIKAVDAQEDGLKMPYILVIIDELADLMMAASNEVEDYIVRITQKARAAGIHLIVATQRPSVDIVTGTIKNNIPSRIAFMVSSQVDSRTILDTAGAERLLGRGDMLYLGNGASQPIRLQGAFVNNQELENVIDFVRQQGQPRYLFTPDSLKAAVDNSESQDELMPRVMKFIAQEDTISTSKLQRVFSIGYNRAANIIDSLQDRNLISEQRGSKPRTVYYHPDNESADKSKDEKE